MTWHGEYREAESLWTLIGRAFIVVLCILAVPIYGWCWAQELHGVPGGRRIVSIGVIAIFLVLPLWRFHRVWRLPARRQGSLRLAAPATGEDALRTVIRGDGTFDARS